MMLIPISKHVLGIENIWGISQTSPLYLIVSTIPEWVWWVIVLLVLFIVNLVIFHGMRIEQDRIMKTYLEEAKKNKDKHPFITDLRISKIAWGLWYTGTIPASERVFEYKKLTRMLVVNPNSGMFKEISLQSGEDEQLGKKKIETIIRDALNAKVKVGIYSNTTDIPHSMTIFDENAPRVGKERYPKSDYAWIVAKDFVRDVSVSDRPLLRIERKNDDRLFNAYFNEFQNVWETSDKVILENNEIKIVGKWGK